MRKVRVRELLLVVALVALGLAWWLDRARLARRLGGATREVESLEFMIGGALDLVRKIEMERREAAATIEELKQLLAECEGLADE